MKIMAYGINSNIQAQPLTNDLGAVLEGIAFSIPLTARTLMITSECIAYMAMTEQDLDIPQKRMVITAVIDGATGTPKANPTFMPAPSGSNGQLWFKAYENGAVVPGPNSFISVMILE